MILKYDVYEDRLDAAPLRQGDILIANKLRDNLRGHQDYFAEQQKFIYYMVLTQSCDLARGGVDFIFLAAVRILNDAIKYDQVQSNKAKDASRNFVRDIYLHNYNKRGYFYLPRDNQREIKNECVVDLRVMFSLHKLHYPDLVEARVCGLTDLYAAQLGHMAGHMFNRVAMPDWEEIYGGNDDFSVSDQAKKKLDELGDRYKQRRKELLSEEGNRCAIQGCMSKADDFRWLPVGQQDDTISFQEKLLCEEHTKQWDENRTLP